MHYNMQGWILYYSIITVREAPNLEEETGIKYNLVAWENIYKIWQRQTL